MTFRLPLLAAGLVAALGLGACQDQPAGPVTPAGQPVAGTGTAQPDADMAEVLTAFAALNPRPIEFLSAEEARRQPTIADAVRRILTARGQPTQQPVTRVEDFTVPGAAGPLQARLYGPARAGFPIPVIVYFHGGGWVIADLDTYDASARALQVATGAVVVSVHYRQGPENKFPAAHEDAIAAYSWVARNAARLGGDPRRVAVAGESAGGNLAVNVAIAARDRGLPRPVHVLAVYPVASGDLTAPSAVANADATPLNRPMLTWFLQNYGDPATPVDPRIDLVGRANLRGLPPTTVITAQIDPLRDGGSQLAERLRTGGVDVAYRNYDGVTHEFFGTGAVVADARDAVAFAAERLRDSFGGNRQRVAAR